MGCKADRENYNNSQHILKHNLCVVVFVFLNRFMNITNCTQYETFRPPTYRHDYIERIYHTFQKFRCISPKDLLAPHLKKIIKQKSVEMNNVPQNR